MFKKGFTLAEVLMTLAIIGVVAAVTLPSLNYNITNQSLEKQLLKFYSQMQDAYNIYNSDVAASAPFNNDAEIRKNFNIVDILDSTRIDTDMAETIGTLSGQAADLPQGQTYKNQLFPNNVTVYVLADGSMFSLRDSGSGYAVTVDVNGKKGPNIIGRDIWKLYIYSDGSIDDAGFTPRFKQIATATDIKTRVDEGFGNCKNGTAVSYAETEIKDDPNDSDKVTRILPEFTDSTNGYGAGCFGKFIRSKFTITE